MTLYDISEEIRVLLDRTEEGELTEQQLTDLDALGIALERKIDGCCALVREWESQAAARQAEIDRLKMGIQTRENNVKRLKEYLRQSLEKIGEKKHETPLFTVWRQASPPSAKCLVQPALLPEAFQRVKYEPDCRAAIEHWKSTGAAPDGFEVQTSEHLRVK